MKIMIAMETNKYNGRFESHDGRPRAHYLLSSALMGRIM
jgi:hypothetical protein